MHPIQTRRRPALGAALVILFVVPSCGGPNMNPPADRARAALEAALNAWREGKRPGNIEGTDPPVQAVDNDWTNGRKLTAFEILRDQPSELDKRFVVKLTYAAPAAVTEAVYIVLGVSPIAVFREEDYARTLNMDNNPEPPRTNRPSGANRRR
jgi:hypothetical protein